MAFLLLNGGAVLAALLVACAVDARVRTSLFMLATLGAYLVVVHSAVLVTGLLGWLTLGGLTTAVAIAVAAAWWWARRSHATPSVSDTSAPFTPATAFAPVAAVLAAGMWARPHLFEATRLFTWDDFAYHMVYPVLWLRGHAIAGVAPPHAFTMQAWYPLSASVVSTWFMAPFADSRGDALAWVSLTGVLYGGIVAFSAAELLTRLGCRRGAWAVPLVLFATSERIGLMASSFSDADLAHAAMLFAALAFATPRGAVESARVLAADAAFAALLTGLAIGVKVSAVPVALVVLGMTAWRARTGHVAGRVLCLFAPAWAVTGAYWFARNVVHTENPVYPAAFLFWPGTTFPQTTLREYSQVHGLARMMRDALVVYLNWPPLHAALAITGLVGCATWLVARRSVMTRPQAAFVSSALAIATVVLVLLPTTPFSAGNWKTFISGFIHWDSMRYVALLPILGWVALGFLVDAGAGSGPWRTAVAIVVTMVAILTAGYTTRMSLLVPLTAIVVATIVAFAHRGLTGRRSPLVAATVLASALAAFVVVSHDAKAGATAEMFYRQRLLGEAPAVFDRQPAGTRVAVFGDQWIYPVFGARHHLVPVRLDRDGRVATAPIGDATAPGNLTVDFETFRANLAASRVAIVAVIHLPVRGRSDEWPTQAAALAAISDARVLYRNSWVGIWKLGD